MLDPLVRRLVDPAIIDGILALTALYNTRDNIDGGAEQSLPHTHTGRSAFEGVRIALRLAQLVPLSPTQDTEDEEPWHVDLQECLRLTAVLFTWTFARRVSSRWEAISSVHNHLRAQLNIRLLSNVLSTRPHSQALSDLMLWTLIVCGSTTVQHDNMVYYAELTRYCFPDSRSQSYETVKKLGERLPWIDVQENAPVEEFWNMVTADSLPSPGHTPDNEHMGPLLVGFVRHSQKPPK